MTTQFDITPATTLRNTLLLLFHPCGEAHGTRMWSGRAKSDKASFKGWKYSGYTYVYTRVDRRKGVKVVVDGEIWHEARPEWTVFLAEYESRAIFPR